MSDKYANIEEQMCCLIQSHKERVRFQKFLENNKYVAKAIIADRGLAAIIGALFGAGCMLLACLLVYFIWL
jgi:hypothetical protein